MMLFFGYIGLLNLVCLAPVMGLLCLLGAVDLAALTPRLLGATVLKGGALPWLARALLCLVTQSSATPLQAGQATQAACSAGLFDNALSDYFWARAVLLIGTALLLMVLCMFMGFAKDLAAC